MTAPTAPRSFTEKLYLFCSGLCMGAADVVPGVSGGTMAFILGVYEELLDAIHSFDTRLVKDVFCFRLRSAFARIPFQFLFLLVGGIFTAILLLAGQIKEWYEHEQVLLFAFFFGLILASIRTLSLGVAWNRRRAAGLLAGVLTGWLVVTLTPHHMPQTPLVLFFSGAIAIMAMILPGISGSFLLLILGQYAWVLEQISTLKTALRAVDPGAVMQVALALLPLAVGAVIGLLAFARLLRWILQRYHHATIAVLIGFMAGSLRKIWPWREATATLELGEKTLILSDRMVLPAPDIRLAIALGLMLFGIALILLLERVQAGKESCVNDE